MWNYNGYVVINGNSYENVKLFDSEKYDNSLSYIIDNKIYIADYDSDHEYNKLIILDVENLKYEEVDLGYNIDFDSWEMKLVNKWNLIHDEQAPELVNISSAYAWANDKRFDARAIDAVTELCKAAHKDGAELYIISAYRTDATQTRLFNNQVNRELQNNPSLTREEAEIEAATAVARPGTSEHQLGLAVDFNSVEDSFRTTNEYSWLVNNCADYGFILRYTEEFRDKTGIIPEPWH